LLEAVPARRKPILSEIAPAGDGLIVMREQIGRIAIDHDRAARGQGDELPLVLHASNNWRTSGNATTGGRYLSR
jgi:hypothetical protein